MISSQGHFKLRIPPPGVRRAVKGFDAFHQKSLELG
jgi:hypothetical protein